jgi:hypothetical protein
VFGLHILWLGCGTFLRYPILRMQNSYRPGSNWISAKARNLNRDRTSPPSSVRIQRLRTFSSADQQNRRREFAANRHGLPARMWDIASSREPNGCKSSATRIARVKWRIQAARREHRQKSPNKPNSLCESWTCVCVERSGRPSIQLSRKLDGSRIAHSNAKHSFGSETLAQFEC